MRLLHLSDIHLSKEKLGYFKNHYLNALFDHLDKINSEGQIDIIVITGDLIDKGGKSFNDEDLYKEFKNEFLEPLLKKVKLLPQQVIMIPGNHDVNESKIDRIYESGLLQSLNSPKEVNEYIEQIENEKVYPFKRLANYNTFINEFYRGIEKVKTNPLETYFIHKIEDVKIGIVGLNSAWRSSSGLTEGNLYLGTIQIMRANDFFDEQNCDLKIGLVHHPLTLFNPEEKKEIENLLDIYKFQILLSGHSHVTDSFHTVTPKGNTFVNIARTAFNDPSTKESQYQSGYSLLSLDFKSQKINCKFFKYYVDRNKFDIDLSQSESHGFEASILLEMPTEEPQNLLQPSEGLSNETLGKGAVSIELFDEEDTFYRSILFQEQRNSIVKFEEILSSKGIVIIEGPHLSGKTNFIKNYFDSNKKYKFIETIPEQIFKNKKRKKPYDDVLDLYARWGQAILQKATEQFQIRATEYPAIWELLSQTEVFNEQIIKNRDLADYDNDLESMFNVIRTALSSTSNLADNNTEFVISAHLDNFETYADPNTFDFFIADLSNLNLKEVKRGILTKMGLVISTRYFPINQLKNIVFKMLPLSQLEIGELFIKIFKSELPTQKEIVELINNCTNGSIWFVNRFFKLLLKLSNSKPNQTLQELAKEITITGDFWITESLFGSNKNTEYITKIEAVYNRNGADQNQFYDFLCENSPDNERLKDYLTNPIIIETGLLNIVRGKKIREPVVDGFNNKIISKFYIEYLKEIL